MGKDQIAIITWKWDAGLHPKKQIRFGAEHVNRLASMMDRHLRIPHQLYCFTDDASGIDGSVRCLPLWDGFKDLPGCFGRLRVFSSEMAAIVGPRFVSIDLDVVIVDDITPLIDRDVDFIIWGEHFRKAPYCGSFLMMNAGCRKRVWDTFDVKCYPPNKKGNWPYGTDQDHICHCLYPKEQMWTTKDGVHNFNYTIRKWEKISSVLKSKYKNGRYGRMLQDIGINPGKLYRPKMNGSGKIPDDARIVFFNGAHDPSKDDTQKGYPWVLEHWR